MLRKTNHPVNQGDNTMEYTLLMDLVSAIASKLAVSGAETYRVEESVQRICAAYGLDADATTVAVGAVIIANDDVKEDDIYNQLLAAVQKDFGKDYYLEWEDSVVMNITH